MLILILYDPIGGIIDAKISWVRKEMKVFIAFGYQSRDEWIRELVFPLVRAFRDEVVTGEKTYNADIPTEVIAKINDSHALIAFLTRRDSESAGLSTTTHWWVLQEIALALQRGIPFVEVREQGIDSQAGIAGNHQRISYIEGQRDRCLVEIAQALGTWHSLQTVRFKILPEACAVQLRSLRTKPDFRVFYQLLINGQERQLMPTSMRPITGGLFIDVQNVPTDSLVRVRVECQGHAWESDYESMGSIGIHLTEC